MKLGRLRRRSGGVIDRRGEGPAGTGGGLGLPGFPTGGRGGGLPIPGGKGGIGIGSILLILVLLFVVPRCLGGAGSLIPNPGAVEGFPDIGSGGGSATEVDPTDPTGQFVDAVQDDIQVTWQEEFQRAGKTYQPTRVVLFRASTRTGCGLGTAQTGPFYCPLDQRVYLDASFSGSWSGALVRPVTSPRRT
jgi:predicted metalloprotease